MRTVYGPVAIERFGGGVLTASHPSDIPPGEAIVNAALDGVDDWARIYLVDGIRADQREHRYIFLEEFGSYSGDNAVLRAEKAVGAATADAAARVA